MDGALLPKIGPLECLIVLMILVMLAFIVWVYWRIFAKSGNPGWLSLLTFVPLANLILLIWFAFSEWPIERELNSLRSMGGQTSFPQQDPPQYPQQLP